MLDIPDAIRQNLGLQPQSFMACLTRGIETKAIIIYCVSELLAGPHRADKLLLKLRVRTQKLFFLFLNQTICCGYLYKQSL